MRQCVRVYKPGGRTENIKGPVIFEDLQRLVGGYVEIVNIRNGLTLACDEDGIPKGYDLCFVYDKEPLHFRFFGTVILGHFTDSGMLPATESEIKEFENYITRS